MAVPENETRLDGAALASLLALGAGWTREGNTLTKTFTFKGFKGAIAFVNRVGHAFIKERMREVDALFAGEVSAHYYFRDFSQADTGVVPFLVMLELLSRAERPLSELLQPFRSRYFLTGEINTPVADVPVSEPLLTYAS